MRDAVDSRLLLGLSAFEKPRVLKGYSATMQKVAKAKFKFNNKQTAKLHKILFYLYCQGSGDEEQLFERYFKHKVHLGFKVLKEILI